MDSESRGLARYPPESAYRVEGLGRPPPDIHTYRHVGVVISVRLAFLEILSNNRNKLLSMSNFDIQLTISGNRFPS